MTEESNKATARRVLEEFFTAGDLDLASIEDLVAGGDRVASARSRAAPAPASSWAHRQPGSSSRSNGSPSTASRAARWPRCGTPGTSSPRWGSFVSPPGP